MSIIHQYTIMIGTILQNKYKIERKIGEGGYALVYRGTHLQLLKPVAIKILKQSDNRVTGRFMREAMHMGQLAHNNIVSVYDVGEHQGRFYIVMEHIDGPSLWELIQQTTLSMRTIYDYALQICNGMGYAHECGIIHRDLSLNNIMVRNTESGNEEIKIVDFGLAGIPHEDTGEGTTNRAGTLYFLAPEIIRNQSADERSDIFSFGVTLYRVVNGHFPFEAEHPAAIFYLIQNEFDLDFIDGIPDRLTALISRCLEKDPKDRVQNFDELIDEFKLLHAQSVTHMEPSVSAIKPLKNFARRSNRRNPYLNRSMIKRSQEFYGRRSEIQQLYSRIDHENPQCVSIVGDRRIGKSSLLYHIYQKQNRRKYMRYHADTICIYLDFQINRDFDVSKFIDYVYNMILHETRGQLDYTKRERSIPEMIRIIKELDQIGKRIVIFMDEWGVVTNNEKFDVGFFSSLRSLANNFNVSYVTTSYRDLQSMCYNKDIADSPFFNIFYNMPLHPLTLDEAVELIVEPSANEGVPLERFTGNIIRLSGYFPIFIQMACSAVFEWLSDHGDQDIDWTAIEAGYMNEAEPHYRFMWDRLDSDSRETLLKVAEGRSVKRRYSFICEELARKGYLGNTDNSMSLFSNSFQTYILKANHKMPIGSIFRNIFKKR